MKKLLLSLAAVAMGFAASAQIGVGLSGGFNLPMGDFGDKDKGGFKSGFGVGVHGRYALNDNMQVGLNTGYYSWTNATLDKVTFRIIPIAGVFDYYFMTEGFKPYAGLDVGFYLGQAALDGKTDNIDAVNKFGLAPHLGAAYGVSDNLDIFGNVAYNMIFAKDDDTGQSDINYIGINVGIMYKIGN